ncbi:MAG: STAS domain-containing protein [Blastochloris sp.]|nr:STAS domain-containing protein [Blastochloris sp.]
MLRSLIAVTAQDSDPLTLRRGQALAVLLALFAVVEIVFGLFRIVFYPDTGLHVLLFAMLALLGATFVMNRAGRLQLAVNVFLGGLVVLIIAAALLSGAPTPMVFFMGLVVVIAAAFTEPRAPAIWAAALTVVPFIINLLLYGSLLAPQYQVELPNRAIMPSLFTMELAAIGLLWLLGGAAYLTTRLLHQTLDENRATMLQSAADQRLLTQRTNELERTLDELHDSIQMRDQIRLDLAEAINTREQLRATLRTLASPVVPVLDGILVMPLIGPVDGERAALLSDSLLVAIERQRARVVIIDVTGVPIVDTQVARVLLQIAESARMLGAQPLLVGMRPELAQTIVGLGLDLSGLITRADLQSGVMYALQYRRTTPVHAAQRT